MSPPFSFSNLFRRKEKKPSEVSQSRKSLDKYSINTDVELDETESRIESHVNGKRISISEALELLKKMDDEGVGDMFRSLIPIRQSLENTLLSLGRLAEEMENEKVKLEEEKFRSAVESSRRILVSSLKKEVPSDYPTPTSIPEAKKFQERLESLMERFGDVSSSHNKLLTTFMKKQTGKIKAEFDIISTLQKSTDKIMESFEDGRQPLLNCISVLNKTSQMVDSVNQQENELRMLKDEILRLEAEDQVVATRLAGLEGSSDFESTSEAIKDIEREQQEEKEFRKYLEDLFSPVSRALTKYSYGTSKTTSYKLKILMEEPWKIFEQSGEQKGADTEYSEDASRALESYSSLLLDVQRAVRTGKITLKDSDKTARHLQLIIESLPELQKRLDLTSSRLKSFEQKKNTSVISLVEDMRKKLRDNKATLEKHRLYMERLENEITERNNNLQSTLRNCEECLSGVTGKDYVLEVASG